MRTRRKPWHFFVLIMVVCFVLWRASYWVFSSGSFLHSARRDNQFNSNRQKIIRVVEEHHDVIPDWFVEMAGSPLGRYIVVHIDAHNDLGMPDAVPEFPKFRLPNKDNEISTCMQANDRFIYSAIATGVVKRVVWIYPFWVSKTLYEEAHFNMGLTAKGPHPPNFCLCEADPRSNKCNYEDPTGQTEKEVSPVSEPFDPPLSALQVVPSVLPLQQNIPISRNDCSNNLTVHIESIKDIYALTRLGSDKTWIPHPSPIVLDIDEDFFGVELPTSHLNSVHLHHSRLEPVSNAVTGLFCPLEMDINSETLVNAWFQDLVRELTEANCAGQSAGRTRQKLCTDETEAYVSLFLPVRGGLLKELSCRRRLSAKVDDDSRLLFLKMWRVLVTLTPSQLTQVSVLGVCLDKSFNSFGDAPTLGLCFGANKVNDSRVEEHPIRAEEVDQQMDRLENIFKLLPRPRLVTISRSSRDGYVPRKWQSEIEEQLLSRLSTVLNIPLENVLYSPLLYGGKEGWKSMYTASLQNTQQSNKPRTPNRNSKHLV